MNYSSIINYGKVENQKTFESYSKYSYPNRPKHNLFIISMFFVFGTIPLYLLPSGGVQLVDIAIVFLSFIVLFSIQPDEMDTVLYLINPFVPFLFWSLLVNTYFAIDDIEKSGFVIGEAQILYTFLITVIFVCLFKRILTNKTDVVLVYSAILLSCLAAIIIKNAHGTIRQSLSFNDPNQLGYFALLILSMLIMLRNIHTDKKSPSQKLLKNSLEVMIFCFANYFVLISISRISSVCVILLDIYLLLSIFKSRFILITLVISVLLSIIIYLGGVHKNYLSKVNSENILSVLNSRFSEDTLQNLKKRTIGNLYFKNELRLIFGNGSKKKFSAQDLNFDNIRMREPHNAILGIFDMFGVVGVIFFICGFYLFAVRFIKSFYHLLIISIFILYNSAQYGFRFRLFWICIALFVVSSLFNNAVKSFGDWKKYDVIS